MTRKILVLDAHPEAGSFSQALAEHYGAGASEKGHSIRFHQISKMSFDPDFGTSDFKKAPSLEPDLAAFWDDLVWCEHFVMVHPLWWGGHPAKLKGLFDRILLPGKAFKYYTGKGLPEGLLKGRTARVVITMDTPAWILKWIYGRGVIKQTNFQILKFCGIKPNRFDIVGPMIKSTKAQREVWLSKAEALGRKAA